MNFMAYQPKGDKKNSAFFDEYRLKIFEWRQKNGLQELLTQMRAVVIQVETGEALDYINELYLMTPYRFVVGYVNATHRIYVLKNTEETPLYLVLEPLRRDYVDENTHLNYLYPLAAQKLNARYIGEIYHTHALTETISLLESHDIRFHMPSDSVNALYSNETFQFTAPSVYTHNRLGYTENPLTALMDLPLGERFDLSAEQCARLEKNRQIFQEKGFAELIMGVDHMATRIFSSDREGAILEFLTCSNYYFWGAYNIHEMNSSTNVCRHPSVKTDRASPAKVFTANNTPFFVNAFAGTPMPTEDFVRNLGPRMHHIAQEVQDGDHSSGQKNVDYVVNALKSMTIQFLAHIVGECTDYPDLKQIFSKRSRYSMLITEYVERCHNFDGFFTKQNVAELTAAAGKDESLNEHGRIFD